MGQVLKNTHATQALGNQKAIKQRLIMLTSLTALVGFAIYLNSHIENLTQIETQQISLNSNLPKIENPQIVDSRAPASVSTGTTQSEDDLAKEVSMRVQNDKTKFGKKASMLEELTFGLLEGRYSVRLENGKLRELIFNSASTEPKSLENMMKFISEHKDLFPVEFKSVQETKEFKENGQETKFYSLFDSFKKKKAEIEVQLDSNGRLLKMSVNSQKSLLN